MAAGEGVSVGAVYGRLGYRYDPSGSQQFDQARQKLERDTSKPIDQELGFDVDDKALADYHRELDKIRARTTRKDDFKAKLGADFDSRAFRQYESELKKAEREAQRMEAQQLKLAASVDHSTRGFDKGSASVDMFARTLRGLFNQSAQITKIGIALQGVSAAGAALGGVVAGLAPLAGGLAAYPALASAAAQGTGVLKLATDGLSHSLTAAQEASKGAHAAAFEAYRGGSEEAKKYRDELEKLNKPQQAFVRSLVEQMPILKQLREDASQGLDSSAKGVQAASKNVGVLRPIVRETSEAIGDLVKRAGELVGSKGFGRDLATQGERNVTWITRGGEAGLNLADALRHVTLAAGPLVDWMTRAGVRFSELIDKQARAGRESGTLAKFFEQTQLQMSRVARIAGDVATALFNIGKQAYPLGSDLLRVLTLNAEKFKDWTESAKGQNAIADFFKRARPAIDEVGRLLVDITKMFFRLGNGDQVAPLLKTIRTELLPVLEKVVDSTTRSFGPVFLEAVKQALLLFSNIAGSSGPLVQFTKLLGRILGGINTIIDKIPVLGAGLATLVAAGGIYKALRIAATLSGLSRIAGLIGALKTAGAAAATTGAAGGAGGGIVSRVLGQLGGRGDTPAKPTFVWVVNGGVPGGGGGGIVSDVAKTAGKGGVAATVGRALAGGGATAAAIALPIAFIYADAERNKLDKLTRQLDQLMDAPRGSARFKELANLEGGLRDAVAAGDPKKLRDIAEQIEAVGKKAEGVSGKGFADLARDIGRFADAKEWKAAQGEADETRKRFKAMRDFTKGSLEDIRAAADDNMGRIRKRIGSDSAGAKAAMRDNFEQAIDAVRRSMREGGKVTKKGMADIRGYVADELQLYGISFAKARHIAAAGYTGDDAFREAGHGDAGYAEKKAGGGWIGQPGMVGQDTVPAMLAPGEAVLNRHQQGVIESLLGGGFLDQLFANVQTPHYMARGGYAGVTGDTDFRPALGRALAAMARSTRTPIYVQSGRRTIAEQAALYASKGPGNAAAPGPNAPHVRGVAADITPGRGVFGGIAARFGLGFTVGHEPWHIQLLNAAAGANAVLASIPRVLVRGGGLVGRAAQGALDMARAGANRLVDGAGFAVPSGESAPTGGGGGSSAQVRAWVAAGLRLAGIPASGGNVSIVSGRVMQESGGNPRAVNNWDINAKNGDPSRGLLQTIGSTFRSYMVKGHSDIYNPVDNVAAAVRYMLARYGHLVGAGPGGYARGGFVGAIQRFARGGPVKGLGAPGKGYATGSKGLGYGPAALVVKPTRDSVGDYDRLAGSITREEKVYDLAERKYNQSDEVFVKDDGTLDQDAIEKRAGELSELVKIRQRVVALYKRMQQIANHAVGAYSLTLKRLQGSLKHARGKDRSGIVAQIKKYTDLLDGDDGWRTRLEDLGFTVQGSELDLGDLANEIAEVRGTKPNVATPDAPASDAGAGITPDQQAQLDQAGRLKEIVAQGDFLNASALKTLQVFDSNKVGQAGVGGAPDAGLVAKAAAMGVDLGGASPAGSPAGGTFVQNNYMLSPDDPAVLSKLAQATNTGNSYLGTVESPRVVLGV